jgi:hypothetical protein
VPPPPGAPSIATIDPSSGLTTEVTPVRITGANFHLSLVTDLDHDTTEIETARASIGTMPLDGVVWRGEGLVEATVPAGTPVGTYDVTVTVGARTATLPGGFTVLPEVDVPLGPFGPPTIIAELADVAVDDDPTITADRLELFFNSDRAPGPGGGDIFVTTRASVSAPWGTPTVVPELSSTSGETTPKISSDGLTIYFASDRLGAGYDLFVSTRASRTSAWSTPSAVVELNTAFRETGASMSPTELSLVLTSDRDGNTDSYLATRTSPTAAWSTPVAIAEANSPGYEADPCLTHQDRVLVFESDRPGSDGLGDLYIATRASSAVPFDPPVPLTELNSPTYEEDAFISDDLHYVLFSSYRSGNWEIYEASR